MIQKKTFLLEPTPMISKHIQGNIELLGLENNDLSVTLAPALGGKILSVFNKPLRKEFLWTNKNLTITRHETGADYDSNFLGAIDELLPNDLAETIDSIAYPDHGELWTTPLQYEITGEKIRLHGKMKLSGLYYSKTVSLLPDAPIIQLDYSIKNETNQTRHFLWKLHAALKIEAGDRLISSAKHAQVVDPEYSRFKKELTGFNWPSIENTDASIVPELNNTMDFFYLYDTSRAAMQMASANGEYLFSYDYDKKIFPYQWYFASYGAFLDHYTAILEPCTNMPMSVNEAKEKKQSAVLQAGETLETSVRIFAGEKKRYIS